MAPDMITAKNLVFKYTRADTNAVDDVSFSIKTGEIFGFLGPNGAGKSTTQKVLSGLLRNYQGQVRVLDREVCDWGSEFYEQVGVGFELPVHYGRLTARENLNYFAKLYQGDTQNIEELLCEVDLLDEADIRVERFSKGMRVRLNFARSVLCQPRLLFLDEPTTGLDPLSAQRIKHLILKHRDLGATVFITTHDMTTADEICDRVAFLVDGQIALIDAPHELKVRYGERCVRLEFADPSVDDEEFPLEGLADNPEFQAALRQPSLQTIHTQETTLQDIFIRATGHQLT
jgi:fluoroquinolone transport system ATP-binding protein